MFKNLLLSYSMLSKLQLMCTSDNDITGLLFLQQSLLVDNRYAYHALKNLSFK